MKNKEKQEKDIIELALANKGIALDIRTMKVCGCNDIGCDYCRFSEENYPYKQGNCDKNCIHWANSEYVEPKMFTKQERTVIKALDKINYVARDKDGDVYGYSDKPTKGLISWSIGKNGFIKFANCTSCEFNSIKWEDTEPTSRETILKEGGNK